MIMVICHMIMVIYDMIMVIKDMIFMLNIELGNIFCTVIVITVLKSEGRRKISV